MEWLGPPSAPTVRLTADGPVRPVVTRVRFPEIAPLNFLHVRFRMKCRNLVAGNDFWSDGRCIIEWHPVAGATENDSVASVRADTPGEITNFVLRPAHGPAVPVLRLEHLGRSGAFELETFEATVVRETWFWKIGRWLLMGGWLAWAYALVTGFGGKGGVRAILAAASWLLMGIYFVVPGPWKNIRPLGVEFRLGPEVTKPVPARTAPDSGAAKKAEVSAAPVESVGNIPLKGDLMLRIKFQLFKLRPLLHALLLSAPAALISLLAGRRAACWSAALLAVAMEVAEASFGYGFDHGDVLDLVWDAVGIGCGLAFAGFFAKRFLTRKSAA